MTTEETERQLDRRLLIRGGAVLAGAAGVAAAGAVLAPATAQAADGQFAVMGQPNTSDSPTVFTLNAPGGATPTMRLTNASGPALALTPTGEGYTGGLKVGEIASTTEGPEVGISRGTAGAETTWLATGLDLDQLPITLPLRPFRLVDTRIKDGREGIRSSSTNAFESDFRLRAGSWFDIAIVDKDYVGLVGVYVNVTGVHAAKAGFVSVYPPGERTNTSTLNLQPSLAVANSALVPAAIAQEDAEWQVIRIYSSTTAHIVVDLTGVLIAGTSGESQSRVGSAGQRKAAKANRMQRYFEPNQKR